MIPLAKGLVIAAAHVLVVSSLGAKLLYDRLTLPRAWVRTTPFDPDLPIRGRYVRLQLVVETRGVREPDPGSGERTYPPFALRIEGDRLLAVALPGAGAGVSPDPRLRLRGGGDGKQALLADPVAFFISEHVPDPSRRPAGEELWVEVTVPGKGPFRPIRLGVKQGEGPIVPLDLR